MNSEMLVELRTQPYDRRTGDNYIELRCGVPTDPNHWHAYLQDLNPRLGYQTGKTSNIISPMTYIYGRK